MKNAAPHRCVLLDLLAAATLVVLVGAVFAQVADHDFLLLDDPECVSENPLTSAGLTSQGVYWAFTTFHFWNWHPLTWLSFQLDATLFRNEQGLWAGGFHLTNVLLHAVGVVNLYLAFAWMTQRRWASAALAAIYAVHPFHVQSVAWIAERKGILSTALGLTSLTVYVWYARRPSLLRYVAFLSLYVASLCSKQMWVTLPFLLLLLDYWPMRRWASQPTSDYPRFAARRLIMEKVPALGLAIVFSAIAYYAQWVGGALDTPQPTAVRIANAITVYAVDLVKTFVPTGFSIFYPYPPDPWSLFTPAYVGGCLALLAACSIAAAIAWRRTPFLFVGWWWYVLALAPVSGVVGIQGHRMADRFTDLPLIGVYAAVVWGFAACTEAWIPRSTARRFTSGVCGLAVISLLSVLSYREVGFWKNDETVADRAAESTTDNYVALNIQGTVLQKRALQEESQGRAPSAQELRRRAEELYRQSLRINPWHMSAHYNLGSLYIEAGRLQDAASQLENALKSAGRLADRARVRNNLAGALDRNGRRKEALEQLQQATWEDPNNGIAAKNYAMMLHRLGRTKEAIPFILRAAGLFPKDPQIVYAAGTMLASEHRGESIYFFTRAAQLKPNAYEPFLGVGRVRREQGYDQLALNAFAEAARLAPGEVEPIRELAETYATKKYASADERTRAVELAMQAATATDWRDWQALRTLGVAQQALGDLNAAIGAYQKAARILKKAAAPDREALASLKRRVSRCREIQQAGGGGS